MSHCPRRKSSDASARPFANAGWTLPWISRARLDGVELSPASVRVPADEMAHAHRRADPSFLDAVRSAARHIRTFQSAILHHDVDVQPRPGVKLRHRYQPLRRVGLCIPGGAAAYPSSLLMTAVPAQVAGVAELAVIAPPTAFGSYNTELLATCHELNVSEVYRLGGAQGIAALAFGLPPHLPPVDKIAGPGNLFVTLAKKHVFGEVDIDALAGPSEVVVIADPLASVEWVTAELLAQAEHAPGASTLITWSPTLAAAVPAEVERQLPLLPRADLIRASLADFAAIIVARDAAQACELCDLLAPEHLHLAVENPESLLPRLHDAGAIFAGRHTPVALGDYLAGPSHVLPTGGTARWASGLSCNSFLRSHTEIQYTPAALAADAAAAMELATREGLEAHAASIRCRLADPS